MNSGLITIMPMALALILVVLCIVYVFAVTYILTRKVSLIGPAQYDVLCKIRRYCKSIPRSESIPVAALERLLDSIEHADTKVDIDKIVIDELFKLRK